MSNVCGQPIPPITQPPYALRDLFALAAMHAQFAAIMRGNNGYLRAALAEEAYKMADAMLAEREREKA